MKFVCLLFVFTFTQSFAQLPTGDFFSIFPDKMAVVSVDSTSITLRGGVPAFDQTAKMVRLDSAQEGNRVLISKLLQRSASNWRIVGKLDDTSMSTYALLDITMVAPETFTLNFIKNEYRTEADAIEHMNDSASGLGFQFVSRNRVSAIMSLRSVTEITAKDLTTIIRTSNDMVNARMKAFENQPDMAMFAMMILPMQITTDVFIAQGYNPYVAQETMKGIIGKFKDDPDVKKAMEEASAQ